MKIFSTFTGIGGFEVGIRNAYRSAHRRGESTAPTNSIPEWARLLSEEGEDTSATQRQTSAGAHGIGVDEGPLFVGYSEIDKHAIKVYERHFGGIKNYGDITKINAKELPDFDCLVGGFPCQAFSIAGKRGGFDDTRGTLFFDLARILREKQPRYFVFENVKGLLSHDKGNTFRTIIAAIDELGYDCQWSVLNSKNFGVPQNRERIIIVGHLRGTARPEVFPIGGADGKDIETLVNSRHDHKRVYGTSGVSATITTGQRGNAQPKILVPEATKKGYAEATVGDAINLSNPKSKTRRGRVSSISPTIETSNQIHTVTDEAVIRRLTPVECERLQTFPDNWTKYGEDERGVRVPISDTQRYKMCGNAVTTNVIQAVFERLIHV